MMPRRTMLVQPKSSHNSVHGVIVSGRRNNSLGRDPHGQQVSPDRHPTTAAKNREILKIATWNVRTMFQKGKLENVKNEAERNQINILGMSEIRWTGTGKLSTDNYTLMYSGSDKHERGVGLLIDHSTAKSILGYWPMSDRILLVKLKGQPFDISIIQVYAPTSEASDNEIEDFYEKLDAAKAQCKSQEVIIVMGDFNAKIGEGREDDIVGPHGLGKRNERGEMLFQWCKANSMIVTNTWFMNHKRRRYTWVSPDKHTRNQIDYILINKRFRNGIEQSMSYPGADCGSDHTLVMAKLHIKLRKLKVSKQAPKYQLNKLRENDVKNEFYVQVSNRFQALVDHTPPGLQEELDTFLKVVNEAAEKTIPKRRHRRNQKWMTDEILEMMEQRRQMKAKDPIKYKELDKNIKQKCNEAKENWWNRVCEDIEEQMKRNPSTVYSKLQEVAGKSYCSSTGCLKARDGTIVMNKDDIIKRWEEYIGELFEDNRGEKPMIKKSMYGPPILKDEVRTAMRSMKMGKAAGPDNLTIEMINALEDMGIDKLASIMNKTYDTGEIPDALSRSIFIALPKRAGATECELHRTISLMSHITKLMLRILMRRIRRNIHEEISDVQCGFMKGKGTTNAISIIRNLCERSIEVQHDLYLCFIDYSKAFDKVQHETLFSILDQLDIDGKTLRWIRNLYWEQTAAVRVDNELSEWMNIKRGVRQGCVLSPDLFSLYSEMILRKIEDIPGILVNGHNINNIRYADDTVLISDTEAGLQRLLDEIIIESERFGLFLNTKKTYTMTVSKKVEPPVCEITAKGDHIKQTENFNYLGSVLTSDGRSDQEIKKRIAIAKDAFNKKKTIFTNARLSMTTKLRILRCYIWSILLYGCETWTISNNMQKKLQAAEMWFYRRMLKISWEERVTNEEVLAKANAKRTIMRTIKSRKIRFLGHVMRRNGPENLAITGKIKGKRARGRQRMTFINNIKEWTNTSNANDVLHAAYDRERWKNMVVNAMESHDT